MDVRADDTAPFDRDAVRRVLARATALDDVDRAVLPDLDGIEPEALVAAAAEVGIPEAAVRRSMAVERLGPRPSRRVGDRLLGAQLVVVDDELAGDAAEALARLDAWLVGGHHLRRERLRSGRGSWTRRRGVLGMTFRTVRHATGEGYLGDLPRIEAEARDTGTGSCVVRISADRSRDRRTRGAIGTAVAGAGVAAATVVAAATGPFLLLLAPVTLAAGAGIAVSGRHRAGDVQGEIDRVLDAVDHAARPTRLAPDVVRRVVGISRRV